MSVRSIIEPEGLFKINPAVGPGETKDVSRFHMPSAAVQFDVASGGYTLEASVDGNVWSVIVNNITTPQVINFNTGQRTHYWRYLRVVTESVGDPAPTVTLGAYEYMGN